MSNVVERSEPTPCTRGPTDSGVELLSARKATLGEGMTIRRLIPQRSRRMVGAWCFVDHFGPVELPADHPGLRVGPHPHIGLQTVTWLVAGEVLHRDSLGHEQLIRPGAVNLMTAGRGISHSEESPENRGPQLHGIQLWVALPEAHHATEPAFEHVAELPRIDSGGMHITVFMGEGLGLRAPTKSYTPILGAELRFDEPGRQALKLNPDFEHALVLVEGEAEVAGHLLEAGSLAYLAPGRSEVAISTRSSALLMLVGGAPFEEEVILWWNFVARTHEEIEHARKDWEGSDRFGRVDGYVGDPLSAPALAGRLK
ncbi:MAG: pirin family protein [Xanthomonadales bacterium]|nr:pirin family protein [Xanthomonadales bacterium]